MLSLLFCVLVFMVFGKLFLFGLKMAWGFAKFFGAIILAPIMLLVLFFQVSVYFAWPILIIVGIVILVRTIDKK